MKSRDKEELVDGLKYIKYSHAAGLIAAGTPFLLPLLILVGIFSIGTATALGGILSFFFFVMSLTQLVFLYNGFKGLKKIKDEELHLKTKKAYHITSIYFFILIGGWILTRFVDSLFLNALIDLGSSIFLLLIHLFTLKILTDKNLLEQIEGWLFYYIYFLIGLEVADFIMAQFADRGLVLSVLEIELHLNSFLLILISVFIIIKINDFFKKVGV